VLFATGFLTGYQMMQKMFTSEGLKDEVVDRLFLYVFVSTLVGARLGHCLFYEPEVYLQDPIRILKIWEGGLASHGAAIGIVTAIILFCRRTPQVSLFFTLDRQAVVTAWMGGLIRIGNFFNSEIIGHPTNAPTAITFSRVDSTPRHPAQLYEAAVYFCLFGLLRWMYSKPALRNRRGLFGGTLLSVIFIARFLIEFLKENQVSFEESMPLNMGQILSIPVILVGITWLIRGLRAQPTLGGPSK
jgi:prolipoprotein diacylglyceryl transferase